MFDKRCRCNFVIDVMTFDLCSRSDGGTLNLLAITSAGFNQSSAMSWTKT
jgi:hypothetical protein